MTSLNLTARVSTSIIDTRRGLVRLHPEVLDALELRPWNAILLTGARTTVALAAPAERSSPTGVVLLDELVLLNLGCAEGARVAVSPAEVRPAKHVTISASRMARAVLSAQTARQALTGKVFQPSDAVSLLPQDVAPAPGSSPEQVRRTLSNTIGRTWTSELLTIVDTAPSGPVAMHPSTVVTWHDGAESSAAPRTDPAAAAQPATASGPAAPAGTDAAGAAAPPTQPRGAGSPAAGAGGAAGVRQAAEAAQGSGAVQGSGAAQTAATGEDADEEFSARTVGLDDLVGARSAADRLTEWLRLSFEQPELLRHLGSDAQLGVLISGPSGVGKATLARAAAREIGAGLVELAAPSIAALEARTAAERLRAAVDRAAQATSEHPCVLLLTDIEQLVPATDAPPLATVASDTLREAIRTPGVAVVVTSAAPAEVDPRLCEPGAVDRELTLSAPNAHDRAALLRVLLRPAPLDDDVDLSTVASKTPGFVAADLVALCREAAVNAALRQRDSAGEPVLCHDDLAGAIDAVRPLSMSTSDEVHTGGVELDDVGDMAEVKQSLTETVLWPLRYPDSFARLGVTPPRGVLLYGPPGCGKTFLVRALAGSGQLNVLSVKGAELMDKWVGESERAVRELFLRAANAAPALVFLDEVDALAPRRGQSADSGTADRVVAALLTEMDGAEPLGDVVVLGATNRPELVDPALLRPGRLERLVDVPPPDAAARAEILRSAAKNTPIASDVDLTALAAELEGYSAADCTALVREAALSAMRESLSAAEVTAAHLDTARSAVRPSLDEAQLEQLRRFADNR
ncbi:AAA family ATPase [Bounagaea algeriensis]